MGAPQVVYLVMAGVGLIYALLNRGRVAVVRFGPSAFGAVVVTVILWWGGFFG